MTGGKVEGRGPMMKTDWGCDTVKEINTDDERQSCC